MIKTKVHQLIALLLIPCLLGDSVAAGVRGSGPGVSQRLPTIPQSRTFTRLSFEEQALSGVVLNVLKPISSHLRRRLTMGRLVQTLKPSVGNTRLQEESAGSTARNVSFGTICEPEHRQESNGLNIQLNQAFNTLRSFWPQVPSSDLLSEPQVDEAYRHLGVVFNFEYVREQIRASLPRPPQDAAQIKIFFVRPPSGAVLFWVNGRYAAAHYSIANNAIYISLPLAQRALLDLGPEEGQRAMNAMALHEDAHLRGLSHEEANILHRQASPYVDDFMYRLVEAAGGVDPFPRGMQAYLAPTYENAETWRALKANQDFRFPRGFWESEEMIRYMILVTLDTVAGFKTARETGNIKEMTALYRTHIKYYVPVNRQKFPWIGVQSFFYERGGFQGLGSRFGIKRGSPATYIRFELPELIDLSNPDALDPLEIDGTYWNDPENGKYHILKALDSIPGFESARDNNDVKVMAELYRQHVMKYQPMDEEKYTHGGQAAYFLEKGGLSGLWGHPREYLANKQTIASLIQFVLPKLIDDKNPAALHSREIDKYKWTKTKIRKSILDALDSIPGFRMARRSKNIKRMAELYRQQVIHYQARTPGKYKSSSQITFFLEHGLSGVLSQETGHNSPAAFIRSVIPGLIDRDNPDAIHPLEVEHRYWTQSKNAKHHVLEALDTIPGFKAARESNDIKTMAILYKQFVIPYGAPKKQSYKANYGGQPLFFKERGRMSGLLGNRNAKYLPQKDIFAALINLSLPGLLDDSNPDALHSEDVGQIKRVPVKLSEKQSLQVLTLLPWVGGPLAMGIPHGVGTASNSLAWTHPGMWLAATFVGLTLVSVAAERVCPGATRRTLRQMREAA